MIHFTNDDAQMLAHVVDVMNERIAVEGGYTEQNEATMTKLEALAKEGAAVVVSGREQSTIDSVALFSRIVKAELDHWVPDSSQRLLFRAGAALGIRQPDPSRAARSDCGPERADHATMADWVGTLYVHRCSSCLRLFKA